ncbi:MAG: 2-amino-4-hydroxy-6-hydroxymethyldihydropteridine diphosphokinase [Phototrophicales bacterium]|nr:MAG: 2-amino-4-hydroxy-6-hydroxymethyldihydropteridine diphosphokinase [Phototrophicales bacterium]
MNQAKQFLLGLGSNLNNPLEQLRNARLQLCEHPQIKLLKSSSIYESLPQGPLDQDNFLNAVIHIETTLSPTQLHEITTSIENRQGRIKTRHWGERCIDIDILFLDDDAWHSHDPELVIPHLMACSRDFVVIPCLEICPNWRLPDGSLLADHKDQCLSHQLVKIALF